MWLLPKEFAKIRWVPPVEFDGVNDFAQSNDIVSKTEYNGTVSGNVTIGSDGEYSYISWVKAGAPIVNLWTNLNSLFNTQEFELHLLVYIPSSEVWLQTDIMCNTLDFNAMRLLKDTNNKYIWYTRQSAWWSDILTQIWTVTHNSRHTVILKATWWVKTMYINDIVDNTQTITSRDSLNGNQRLFVSNTTNYWTYNLWYIRAYSTALTDEQRTAELELWQKQTARKDCVLEILPDYFALPASPTTVYDSVGNNNGTITGTTEFLSDTDWQYRFINWVSEKFTATAQTQLQIANNSTIILKFKTSDVTTLWKLFTNQFSASDRIVLSYQNWILRWWLYNWSAYVWVKNFNISTNTLYTVVFTNEWGTTAMYVNWSTASVWANNPSSAWVGLIVGDDAGWAVPRNIYFVRTYSSVLSSWDIASESALWYWASQHASLVSEYWPSPSTIYDVKAFTPATPVVIQCSFKLNEDVALTKTICLYWFGSIVVLPATNILRNQYNDWVWKFSDYVIWVWDRNWHTVVATKYLENWVMKTKIFVDWVLRDSDTHISTLAVKQSDNIFIGRWSSATNYFNWTISETKIYIWTITDSEWVAMSSWIPVEPANATLLCQPRRLPPYNNVMTDVSGNWYDFTLTT